jgi:hypothetical protein
VLDAHGDWDNNPSQGNMYRHRSDAGREEDKTRLVKWVLVDA